VCYTCDCQRTSDLFIRCCHLMSPAQVRTVITFLFVYVHTVAQFNYWSITWCPCNSTAVLFYLADATNAPSNQSINHGTLCSIATSRLNCYSNNAVRQSVKDRLDDEVWPYGYHSCSARSLRKYSALKCAHRSKKIQCVEKCVYYVLWCNRVLKVRQ